jgi:DNA-binding XRE family transcriptional regulator
LTYATKIKKLRDEMLLTQEEFGKILGVSLVLNI